MSLTEYVVNVCPVCASSVVGFVLEKTSQQPERKETKCVFCHKKRYCDVYRLKAEKEE